MNEFGIKSLGELATCDERLASIGQRVLVEAGRAEGVVLAALFSIDKKELRILDRVEGAGYHREKLQPRVAGKTFDAVTYFASTSLIDSALKPFHWYKNLVVEGAKYLSFPKEYLEFLNGFESIQDQNDQRRIKNEALLTEMKKYCVDFPYA